MNFGYPNSTLFKFNVHILKHHLSIRLVELTIEPLRLSDGLCEYYFEMFTNPFLSFDTLLFFFESVLEIEQSVHPHIPDIML